MCGVGPVPSDVLPAPPQGPSPPRPSRERAPRPRALSNAERAEVLGALHHERFVDQATASIYANLLDEGSVSRLRSSRSTPPSTNSPHLSASTKRREQKFSLHRLQRLNLRSIAPWTSQCDDTSVVDVRLLAAQPQHRWFYRHHPSHSRCDQKPPPAVRCWAGPHCCGTARAARAPPAKSRAGGVVAPVPICGTRPATDAN